MSQPRFLEVTDASLAQSLVERAIQASAILGGSDATFISDLLAQRERKQNQGKKRPMDTLSGAQWWWLNHKIEKAAERTAPVEREKVEIGECKGIIRLFDKAKQHLKKPAVVVAHAAEDGDTVLIRLKPASPNGRSPDSIDVMRYEDRAWLGRIHKDGQFELASKMKAEAREVAPALRRFAADPVTGAKESARLTGRCCFCHTPLKDERSTSVGYGPICADHYNLPWA